MSVQVQAVAWIEECDKSARHADNPVERATYANRAHILRGLIEKIEHLTELGVEIDQLMRESQKRHVRDMDKLFLSRKAAQATLNEVIATHADDIGTHYGDCYRWHAGCLAVLLRDQLEAERRPAGAGIVG